VTAKPEVRVKTHRDRLLDEAQDMTAEDAARIRRQMETGGATAERRALWMAWQWRQRGQEAATRRAQQVL